MPTQPRMSVTDNQELISLLIPPDRLDEEPAILARIRRGERIDHYETVADARTAAWSRFR